MRVSPYLFIIQMNVSINLIIHVLFGKLQVNTEQHRSWPLKYIPTNFTNIFLQFYKFHAVKLGVYFAIADKTTLYMHRTK